MKILFTTETVAPTGHYEYFSGNFRSGVQIVYPMRLGYGLRFLKQNLPEIEILEFPTWEEYTARLSEGWDVVGFSFHTQGAGRVLKMAEEARRLGVSALWAGNYGALDPALAPYFDRVFTGYAEEEVARELSLSIPRLRHPPLIDQWYIRPLPFRVQRVAILFTQRGCPMKCAFCQTPAFSNRLTPIPIESLEEVIRFYRANGVDWIMVMDEHFGLLREHSEKVLELFQKYRMFWSLQTSASFGLKRLDDWNRAGLMGIGVGIETVNQKALSALGKSVAMDDVRALEEELHRKDRYLWGYYMLGHEEATVEGTLEEIGELLPLRLGFCQVTVMTPFPETPLWDHISERYGIFETGYERFDTKHLVWNHPNLNAAQLERLLGVACERLNRPGRFLKWTARIYKSYSSHLGSYGKGLSLISSFPLKSYRYPKTPPLLPAEPGQ